jgi:tetratricopeptide (TPR) repeat protein
VFPRLCRKANPSECVNIETLKKGLIIEDDFYKTNLTIPKSALESGIYLKSLSDPKELSASLYLGLGYITAQAKQTAVAELFYKKAIAKSPTFADAYSNLASIQAELGDSKEIETLLKKAIALNPTHYATLLNLGVLQFKKGDLSEAITFYSKAIESNPLSVHAYRRRALALKQGNQLKAALLDLDRILVIQPKFCDVQEERNSISKKLGKHIDAKALKELAQLRAARACLMLAQ